ncbi:MAG: VOC family protein [Saprospiraceae bacterium]
MTTVNPYLVFKGNCEEAFNFYKSAFGGDFRFIGRYKELPPSDRALFPPDVDEKIMHVTLPISAETLLMGCDNVDEAAPNIIPTPPFSLSITTDTKEEADRLFLALSVDGEIKMPMDKTFWGSYFGTFEDKFGINWMISFELPIE